MRKAITLRIGVVLSLLTTLMALPLASARAATVPVDLCATSGTTTMPDAVTVTVLGYLPGDCTTGSLDRPGGPVIEANVGDTVEVTLHNNLSERTALLFGGQPMVPDLVGMAPTDPPTTYSFQATNPGTYLYEAGLLGNAQHQTAMGLYGVLVVHPDPGLFPGSAYADGATAYDVGAPVLLSEIDPLLNNRTNTATFDMRNFRAKYWLINGYAFDPTLPAAHNIPVPAGARVLLRFVNAGLLPHSMGLLGLGQTVISSDGGLLQYSKSTTAETIAPGESIDALVDIPSAAADGSLYPLYDTSMQLHNSGKRTGQIFDFGGMLNFIQVDGTATGGGGPETSSADVSPSPTNGTVDVSVTATVAGTATGAEFFIDDSGVDGAGTPMTVVSGSATGTIPAAVVATLTSGPHPVLVHATDGVDWGAYDFATLVVDTTGPPVSGLTLTPAASNGSTSVALAGTADDSTTGNSNVVGAEYFTDVTGAPGSGTAMSLGGPPDPVRALNATISAGTVAGLSAGPHTISVHALDASGYWGAFKEITLVKDTTGPSTTGLTATPSANNGKFALDATNQVVRLQATFTDADSTIKTGEGFIDTLGAPGSGFPFTASDGLFNGSSELSYGDIPLTTINLLANGDHTFFVRAKDVAGNWGPAVSMPYRIDRTKPTVTGVSGSPNPTNTTSSNNVAFTLTATATDAGSFPTKIVRAEWYEGADPGAGLGTAMNPTDGLFNTSSEALTATMNYVAWGWAAGTHTINVRAMDEAGNWSTVASTAVNVVLPNNVFADGFESGNTSAWWLTTGPTSQISVFCNPHTPSALVGNCSLQSTPIVGQPAYVTDATPRDDGSYHARFSFRRAGSDATFGQNRWVRIFSGLDSANAPIFTVEMRRLNTSYQLRMGMQRTNAGGGFVYTSPTAATATLNATVNTIEIAWLSGTGTGLKASLWVNRNALSQTATATLSGTTSAFRLETVRLGPSAITGSGAMTGATLYFDGFASTRRTAIGP